jgi:hypothetical protein
MRLLLLALPLGVVGHYSIPPCAEDEVEVALTAPELGRTRYGILCSSNCSVNASTCPTDVPQGVKAKPKCSLTSDNTSHAFCALQCKQDSDCGGNGSSCLGIVPGLFNTGTCAYSGQISLRTNPHYCLDLAGDITDNGASVWLWPCGNGTYPGQQWAFGYGGDQSLALTTSPMDKKKCLDLTNGNQTNWTPLELWDCVENKNQQWTYDKQSGQISLSASGAKKCVDVRDGLFAPGTIVQLYDCNSPWPQQQWDITGAAADAMSIQRRHDHSLSRISATTLPARIGDREL